MRDGAAVPSEHVPSGNRYARREIPSAVPGQAGNGDFLFPSARARSAPSAGAAWRALAAGAYGLVRQAGGTVGNGSVPGSADFAVQPRGPAARTRLARDRARRFGSF